MIDIAFRDRLKKMRVKAGLTQVEMAALLKVSAVTYNRYEGGTRTPTIDILLKVAQIFHCTTDELLGYSLDNASDIQKTQQRIEILEDIINRLTMDMARCKWDLVKREVKYE